MSSDFQKLTDIEVTFDNGNHYGGKGEERFRLGGKPTDFFRTVLEAIGVTRGRFRIRMGESQQGSPHQFFNVIRVSPENSSILTRLQLGSNDTCFHVYLIPELASIEPRHLADWDSLFKALVDSGETAKLIISGQWTATADDEHSDVAAAKSFITRLIEEGVKLPPAFTIDQVLHASGHPPVHEHQTVKEALEELLLEDQLFVVDGSGSGSHVYSSHQVVEEQTMDTEDSADNKEPSDDSANPTEVSITIPRDMSPDLVDALVQIVRPLAQQHVEQMVEILEPLPPDLRRVIIGLLDERYGRLALPPSRT